MRRVFSFYVENNDTRKEETMKDFKKFGGEHIYDLGQYVRDYVTAHKDVTVYVGSDSEQFMRFTQYATVVVFRHASNGAHYIFYREKVKRVKDLFTRLWGEVDRVLTVGIYLEKELEGFYQRSNSVEKLVELHLDLNPNPLHKSNIVFNAGVSTLKGYGFRVKCKPEAWAASCAADLICRK